MIKRFFPSVPVRTDQGEQWVRLPSGQIIGSKSD
jgi:hypothetical protein